MRKYQDFRTQLKILFLQVKTLLLLSIMCHFSLDVTKGGVLSPANPNLAPLSSSSGAKTGPNPNHNMEEIDDDDEAVSRIQESTREQQPPGGGPKIDPLTEEEGTGELTSAKEKRFLFAHRGYNNCYHRVCHWHNEGYWAHGQWHDNWRQYCKNEDHCHHHHHHN